MDDKKKAIEILDAGMRSSMDLYHSISVFPDHLMYNNFLGEQYAAKQKVADIQNFIDGVRGKLLLEIHKEEINGS